MPTTFATNDASIHSQNDSSSPVNPPANKIPRMLEIDTFCTKCHYNLHSQIVTVDDRLGFPICRCPECGTFHPAGVGVTASTLWVRRLASVLLLVWVGLVIAGVIGVDILMFALQTASVEAFTYFSNMAPSPSNRLGYVELLHDWTNAGTPELNGFITMVLISIGSLLMGFIAGTLCVTLMWHWQRARYLWTLIVPVFPVLILMQVYRNQLEYRLIVAPCIEHVCVQAAFDFAGIFIGIWIGRKVSRLLVRMVIPPKPRQALAFLWTVDGLLPS